MRRVALASIVLVGTLASCSGDDNRLSMAARKSPSNEPVLGITWTPRVSWGMQGGQLRPYDPRSLEPVPGARLELREHGFSWAYSPDGTMIALGGFSGRIRLLDTARLRPLAGARLGRPRGLVIGLTWIARRQVLALVENDHARLLRAVVVDPVTGEVARDRRFELDGSVTSVAAMGGEALVALAVPVSLGPARVVVARADGRASEIVLDELSVGLSPPGPGAPLGRQSDPGFAVDAEGERAFVLSGDGPAAEIDLRSGRVAYHALARPISLLERFHDWLEPEAHAKVPAGPIREAAWAGEGTVAVSGSDWSATEKRFGGARFFEWDEKAAGLHLIDTARWTVRTADERASRLTVSDGIVLAFGGDDDARTGMGVVAYARGGQELWRRFEGRTIVTARAHGGRAYVEMPAGRGRRTLLVLDLETGRIVTRRPTRGSLPLFVVPELVNRYG